MGDRQQRESRGAILTVDVGALVANYRLLRERLGRTECGAVLKADAYGIGIEVVAPPLLAAGCRQFFVAHLEEGIALRRLMPSPAVIYVMHGVFAGWEAECLQHSLVPVLNSLSQIARWSSLAEISGRKLSAAVQIDTGMSRFGLSPAELQSLAEAAAYHSLDLKLVMSHLACADMPDHPANGLQLESFGYLRQLLPPAPASLVASSGVFLPGHFHHQLARPGAALFGVAPNPTLENPLRPVVRLDAHVVQLRDVPAGTAVGYGHSARVNRPSRLATIAVGYADGFLRSSNDSGAAWFDGMALPMLGRVSMDSIVLDVTEAPHDALHEGSLVELIGPHRDVDAVAADMGTIGYEVLTALGNRYQRKVIPVGNNAREGKA